MIKKIAQIIISIILIAIIIFSIGAQNIIGVLLEINLIYLMPVFFIYILLNLLLAYRIDFLLQKLKYKIGFVKVFFAHMFGMLLSEITPGKSGYISLAFSFKKLKVPRRKTLSVLGIVQIGDFLVKVIGALLSLLLLSTILFDITSYVFIGIGTAIMIIIGASFILWSEKSDKLFSPFKRFKLGKKIFDILPHIRKNSHILKRSMLFVLTISLVGWLLRGLEWYYLGSVLNMDLGFMIFLLLHPLLTLLSFVPITPAGIGIMEGGAILILTFFGVPPEIAFTFALLSRGTNALVDLIGIKEIFHF